MSTSRRPTTLVGIKSLARDLKSEMGATHHQALNQAAKMAGFENFKHAQNALASPDGWKSSSAATKDVPPFGPEEAALPQRDFHTRSLRRWAEGVDIINPARASSLFWTGLDEMIQALAPFMGQNHNHTHLPSGGGVDVLSVRRSRERGLLELSIDDRLAYLAQPRSLRLERIGEAPGESFLLLELHDLRPTGIYTPRDPANYDAELYDKLERSEELLELSPGDYEDRAYWDENRGPDGEDLPDDARLVVRWLGGKMMLMAKGSLWNGASETYDGRHSEMTAEQIRGIIERSLKRSWRSNGIENAEAY